MWFLVLLVSFQKDERDQMVGPLMKEVDLVTIPSYNFGEIPFACMPTAR